MLHFATNKISQLFPRPGDIKETYGVLVDEIQRGIVKARFEVVWLRRAGQQDQAGGAGGDGECVYVLDGGAGLIWLV